MKSNAQSKLAILPIVSLTAFALLSACSRGDNRPANWSERNLIVSKCKSQHAVDVQEITEMRIAKMNESQLYTTKTYLVSARDIQNKKLLAQTNSAQSFSTASEKVNLDLNCESLEARYTGPGLISVDGKPVFISIDGEIKKVSHKSVEISGIDPMDKTLTTELNKKQTKPTVVLIEKLTPEEAMLDKADATVALINGLDPLKISVTKGRRTLVFLQITSLVTNANGINQKAANTQPDASTQNAGVDPVDKAKNMSASQINKPSEATLESLLKKIETEGGLTAEEVAIISQSKDIDQIIAEYNKAKSEFEAKRKAAFEADIAEKEKQALAEIKNAQAEQAKAGQEVLNNPAQQAADAKAEGAGEDGADETVEEATETDDVSKEEVIKKTATATPVPQNQTSSPAQISPSKQLAPMLEKMGDRAPAKPIGDDLLDI